MATYAIKDIQPNPFRHISRYPIRRDKVAALRESMRTTSFWENVVARPNNGKAEIAYGHHRLVALKEEYGPNHKVNLILRKLGDDQMLQIMARENMEEWGTSASVEHETIRAVVDAYAKGRIDLPAPDKSANKSQIRHAPSFVPGEEPPNARSPRPYTAQTLAKFIGWVTPSGEPQDKIAAGLTSLQFIEEGLLKESDFAGLTTKQAEAVIAEARKARGRRDVEARVHQMQAEEAEREARLAAGRREEAERERRRMEAEAARACDTEARREAGERARRFAAQQREAQRTERQATARSKAARSREEASREEGRQRATKVARAVSGSLRTGKIGYRQAADVAIKAEGKREGAPKYLEEYAKKLASDLNQIFDPDRDPRAKRLAEMVKYADNLDDSVRADLGHTLVVVANRALGYARQFGVSGSDVGGRIALPVRTGR